MDGFYRLILFFFYIVIIAAVNFSSRVVTTVDGISVKSKTANYQIEKLNPVNGLSISHEEPDKNSNYLANNLKSEKNDKIELSIWGSGGHFR